MQPPEHKRRVTHCNPRLLNHTQKGYSGWFSETKQTVGSRGQVGSSSCLPCLPPLGPRFKSHQDTMWIRFAVPSSWHEVSQEQLLLVGLQKIPNKQSGRAVRSAEYFLSLTSITETRVEVTQGHYVDWVFGPYLIALGFPVIILVGWFSEEIEQTVGWGSQLGAVQSLSLPLTSKTKVHIPPGALSGFGFSPYLIA